MRRAAHEVCQFAIPRQTHFREEIEIVLADHDELRAVTLERPAKAFFGRLKRGIEQCNLETGGAQARCGDQRLQGGIGLHFSHLFMVEKYVIAVREEDPSHTLPSAIFANRP
jgi:hypothetical protein